MMKGEEERGGKRSDGQRPREADCAVLKVIKEMKKLSV